MQLSAYFLNLDSGINQLIQIMAIQKIEGPARRR